jgi:hypothetical protein
MSPTCATYEVNVLRVSEELGAGGGCSDSNDRGHIPWNHSGRRTRLGFDNIEGPLDKIESKLSASFSAPSPSVVPDVGFHLSKHKNVEYTGNHEACHCET